MTSTPTQAAGVAADPELRAGRGPLPTVWTAISGATGVVVGIAPHVLHHVGPLVGTAFVAGAGGTALFALVGLVAAIPMLVRLRRRFHSWWAPGIALCVFVAAFVVSTTVLGPLIRDEEPGTPVQPMQSQLPPGHAQHHR
jgi:hypothetical protein